MYEFNKKETRKKFKQTKYGKDTNRWLYIALFVTIIYVTVCVTLCILCSRLSIELNCINQNLLILLKALTVVSVMCMCYFDGKRDGAIEQFKKTLKKD